MKPANGGGGRPIPPPPGGASGSTSSSSSSASALTPPAVASAAVPSLLQFDIRPGDILRKVFVDHANKVATPKDLKYVLACVARVERAMRWIINIRATTVGATKCED